MVLSLQEDHDLNMGISKAEAWGQQYFSELGLRQFPRDLVDDHTRQLQSASSLEQFAIQRQSLLTPNRISEERVRTVILPLLEQRRGSNVVALVRTDFEILERDYRVLLEFARDGIPIVAAPNFRPSPRRGPLSSSHKTAPTAVAAHVHKGCQAGLYAAIDGLVADTHPFLADRNEISSGVAPKKGKPGARPTVDPSHNSARTPPYLNSPEAVEIARALWGDIDNPTVIEIVQLIVAAAERFGGYENIVIFKGDLRGAYTLLRLRPSQVHLLASRLADGTLTLPLWGNFGWAPMGFAFQVVTRVLVAVCSVLLVGYILMYIDDYIGVSPRAQWERDQQTIAENIRNLLGSDAEETAKRESTEDNSDRSLVVLGWSFSLSLRTVGIARHNRAKAIYRFGSIDLEQPVPKRDIQAICSLAQRYSLVHTELGVLLPDLNCLLAGWTAPYQRITIPKKSKTAIQIWLAHLVVEHIKDLANEPRGRPFNDLTIKPPAAVVEFDGSLTGIGVRVFLLHADNTPASKPVNEQLIAAASVPIRAAIAKDASYQNAAELMALTIGLAILGELGHRHITVHARGDSISVLEWTAKNRSSFRSTIARNAIMALTAVKRHYALNIDQTYTHISSEQNHVCDALSRGRQVHGLQTIPIHSGGRIEQLVQASNPLHIGDDAQFFADKLQTIYSVLEDDSLLL